MLGSENRDLYLLSFEQQPNSYSLLSFFKVQLYLRDSNFQEFILQQSDVQQLMSLILNRVLGQENSGHQYIQGFFHNIRHYIYYFTKNSIVKSDNQNNNKNDEIINYYKFVPQQVLQEMGILKKEYLFQMTFFDYDKKSINRILQQGNKEQTEKQLKIQNQLYQQSEIQKIIKGKKKNIYSKIPDINIELKEQINSLDLYQDIKDQIKDIITSPITMDQVINSWEIINFIPSLRIQLSLEKIIKLFNLITLLINSQSLFTQIHSIQVQVLQRDLQYELYKNYFEQNLLYQQGIVHDIGKQYTPFELLYKKYKLTPQEYFTIKLHQQDTYRVLSQQPELKEISYIQSLHHEKLDGSGYPWGLNENEISIQQRILTIQDIFTQLTEDRPYRQGLDKHQQLKILKDEQSNNKVDKDIVQILEIMLKNGYDTKERIKETEISSKNIISFQEELFTKD